MDAEKLVDVLHTNTTGPALISQVYMSFVEKGHAKKGTAYLEHGREHFELRRAYSRGAQPADGVRAKQGRAQYASTHIKFLLVFIAG